MNDLFDSPMLDRIGLTPALRSAMLTTPHDDTDQPRRVVEVQRGGVLTLHDGLQPLPARTQPALAHRLADDDDTLAVGDWVWAARDAHGGLWVVSAAPRQTLVSRRVYDEGGGLRRQVLVANVDLALLVMGCDHDFNLRRLERYLTLARLAGVQAVVVLTKADLLAAPERERRVDAARTVAPAEVPVFAVCGRDALAREALTPWLARGQTAVLLGSSGAGKSTLTNTLCQATLQDTGAVRDDDSRGRHTTTARSLHLAPGGACIIDTPGLRTLRLDAEDAQAIDRAFGDIAQAALQCRFRDCRHQDEPGCAVRDAVPAQRLHNWHKLQREAARDSMTILQRREQLAEWKARSRAAAARERSKRSG